MNDWTQKMLLYGFVNIINNEAQSAIHLMKIITQFMI